MELLYALDMLNKLNYLVILRSKVSSKTPNKEKSDTFSWLNESTLPFYFGSCGSIETSTTI